MLFAWLLSGYVSAQAKEGDRNPLRAPEDVLQAGARIPLKLRIRALHRLAERAHTSGVRLALAAALDDQDPTLRKAVLEFVRLHRCRHMSPALIRRLGRETVADMIPSYLLALGAILPSRSGSKISPYVSHAIPAVRAAALTALADMKAEDARRLALHVLRDPRDPDPGWVLRSAALLALAKCGYAEDLERIRSIVKERAGEKHWLARSAMVKVVAGLHPLPAAELSNYTRDGDSRVALTAMRALKRVGGLSLLRPLLKHRLAQTRAAAVRAVIPTRDEDLVAVVLKMAERDPSRVVRWAAATSLFVARHPAADALIVDGLRAEDPAIWSEALSLLMARTGESHGRDAKAWKQSLARWRSRESRSASTSRRRGS